MNDNLHPIFAEILQSIVSPMQIKIERKPCHICQGNGWRPENWCGACAGHGYILTEVTE